MGDLMAAAKRAWRILSIVITTAAMSSIAAAQDPTAQPQEAVPPPRPQPTNQHVLRGCLKGSTLADIEPTSPLRLPEKLRVTSIRAIRSQVTALGGHQVEVTGALFGVPGVEEGTLLGDSGTLKVYLGGKDPNITDDLLVNRDDPPSIRATMIKDLAPACKQQ
jgi:hypothetical protein